MKFDFLFFFTKIRKPESRDIKLTLGIKLNFRVQYRNQLVFELFKHKNIQKTFNLL